MFKNLDASDPVALVRCKLVSNGTLSAIAIFGNRVSLIIHTLYCYWKIVHPVHQRKYYRRWMVYTLA